MTFTGYTSAAYVAPNTTPDHNNKVFEWQAFFYDAWRTW